MNFSSLFTNSPMEQQQPKRKNKFHLNVFTKYQYIDSISDNAMVVNMSPSSLPSSSLCGTKKKFNIPFGSEYTNGWKHILTSLSTIGFRKWNDYTKYVCVRLIVQRKEKRFHFLCKEIERGEHQQPKKKKNKLCWKRCGFEIEILRMKLHIDGFFFFAHTFFLHARSLGVVMCVRVLPVAHKIAQQQTNWQHCI